MMKAKWVVVAALLSMSAGALADGTYQYESVTKLASDNLFYGVLVGDTLPTTLSLTNIHSRCLAWVELMLKEPGKYLLSVTVTTTTTTVPIPSSTTGITSCHLEAA